MGVVISLADLNARRPHFLRMYDLHDGRVLGHDDRNRYAEPSAVVGESLSVIARRPR